MHGISKEILKLVRASSALHAIADRSRRAKASFLDRIDRGDPEYDTEDVYFELLREIGRTVELRVVVDIIAGASAGGINGTMLARALSHDLPMDALRDLWLENADVAVLLAPDARASAWSKWFIKPFLWVVSRTGSFRAITDIEVRQKLSLFVRSRWFKPPLDGRVMAGLMYDAVTSMGAAKSPHASLLPSGQSLDLFVALTDYYGYQQLVQIHDPPLIHERDHHHILHFGYRRRSNGEVESDFGLDNAPGLAFAARATASFLDGSVLNNRPFQQAISAIYGRPAFREVDRRLVYIDPHPASAALPRQHRIPGFFATLRGALSDIPSSQPVTDELTHVVEFNDQVRRLRAIVDSARPQVSELVSKVVTTTFDRPISTDDVRGWREQVNVHVARDAGCAYQAYVRLKLASVRASGAELIVNLRGVPAQSPLSRVVAEIIDAWALRKGIVYERADSEALEFETQTADYLPAWVKYLLAFDVKYRERRLHFLIKGQNRLYQLIGQDRFVGLDPLVVDRLKREFYVRLDALRRRENADFYSREVRDLVADTFPAAPSAAEVKHLEAFAARFVAQHVDQIDRLIERLAAEIDLNASTRERDDLLASLDPTEWHADAQREVLVNYLGFPFWDVLTFPMTRARELSELNEILIDRISPQDVHTLSGFDGIKSLKGIGFGHFAAFLSRAYRENDYLIGRLHALDRLIDIVCDAAGVDPKTDRIDVLALKKRGFATILAAEEPHLTRSRELIAGLRRSIGEIGGSRGKRAG